MLTVAYLSAVRVAAKRYPARAWPASRAAAFLAGLAVIAVATQGSVGSYDDVLFSAHMVQHLLLIMVAPPLLIFGRPVTLLLRVTRGWTRARVVVPISRDSRSPPGAYCAAGPDWSVPLMFLSRSCARAARALSSFIVSRKNCAMSFSPAFSASLTYWP